MPLWTPEFLEASEWAMRRRTFGPALAILAEVEAEPEIIDRWLTVFVKKLGMPESVADEFWARRGDSPANRTSFAHEEADGI